MARHDGRDNNALRSIDMQLGFLPNPAGNVLYTGGNTRVICSASIESNPPTWLEGKGSGWISAEYAMLPAATHTRGRREKTPSGRSSEIQRLVGRSLRAAFDLKAMGEGCSLRVDCDVIQADAGTRTASISGGFVACYKALEKFIEQSKSMSEVPVISPVAAVSVGIINDEVVLDMDYREDSKAQVDMNVVMNADGRFIEIQGTAENGSFSDEQLAEMMAAARNGIMDIVAAQKAILGI